MAQRESMAENKIFVGNLPFSASTGDVETVFATFGEIQGEIYDSEVCVLSYERLLRLMISCTLCSSDLWLQV